MSVIILVVELFNVKCIYFLDLHNITFLTYIIGTSVRMNGYNHMTCFEFFSLHLFKYLFSTPLPSENH